MRNKVGLYIREASEKRRYLKPHTKNSYAVVDNKRVFIAGGVYHLRYNNRWERLRGDYKTAQLLQRKHPEISSERAEYKSDATFSGYSYTLGEFQKSCQKPLKEISKQDLIDFVSFMKKKGLGDRTINNRLVEVGTFLKANGVKDVTLSQEYVEKKVKAYRPDELKTCSRLLPRTKPSCFSSTWPPEHGRVK
jgi:hypothetical protein